MLHGQSPDTSATCVGNQAVPQPCEQPNKKLQEVWAITVPVTINRLAGGASAVGVELEEDDLTFTWFSRERCGTYSRRFNLTREPVGDEVKFK